MTETFKRKNLFQLTLPLFFFGIMTIGVNFADTMLLSNYSDNLAASVSVANQILGIGYDLSGLMSIGALILISQYLGRGDVENAKNIARIGFIASLIFGLLIGIFLSGGATFYADWINTPPEIYSDVLIYVYSVSIALIFLGFINTAFAALRGFGKTLEILLIGIVGNVVYLLLEYALIYGAWGLPELGIYGAALASVLIRGINVVLLICLLQWRLGLNVFAVPPDLWAKSKKILKLSYPSVSEALGYQLYQLFIVSLVASIGVAAVLTRSYALTITQLLAMIVLVISYGNEILIGYDKGAADHEIAYKRAIKTALMAGVTVMLIGLVIAISGDFFLRLFTQDDLIVSAAHTILYIHIFSIPFQAVNLILFNSLKAVGDVNRPVIVNLAITFVIALPLAWIFVDLLDMGVEGLWYVYIIEEIIKALAMFSLWSYRGWHRLRVISETPDAAS